MDEVAECLALLPSLPRGKALDFGAGTGRLSFALAAHFTSVTCVDVSSSMRAVLLERARTRGIHNIEVIPSEALPAPGHAFVLSLITLQHLSGPREIEHAVQVLVGSLMPGGFGILKAGPHRVALQRDSIRSGTRSTTYTSGHGISVSVCRCSTQLASTASGCRSSTEPR